MKYFLCVLAFFMVLFSYADNYGTVLMNHSSQPIQVSCGQGTDIATVLPHDNDYNCPNNMNYPAFKNVGNAPVLYVCVYKFGISSFIVQPNEIATCNNQFIIDAFINDINVNIGSIVIKDQFQVKCGNEPTQNVGWNNPINCSGLSQDIVISNNTNNDYNIFCFFGTSLNLTLINFNNHSSVTCGPNNYIELIVPKNYDVSQILHLMNQK